MGQIYDRKNGEFYEDKQYGARALNFLYGNALGRLILKYFIVGRLYSEYNAKRNRSARSVKKIAPFVKEYGIKLDDFENREFESFSDFFTRKLGDGKREFALRENDFISVADSKLLCYEITNNGKIPIKNSIYTANEIVNEEIDSDFYGGYCLVFRLSVDDYHRYCFFDNGNVERTKYVAGKLHTVSPISSKRYKVFSENCRSISYLNTENFGECYQIEVGALLVGKINNHSIKSFSKGEEKGYFEMGGSTIVVMVKKGVLSIDQDILNNSKADIETKVLIGERIGHKDV